MGARPPRRLKALRALGLPAPDHLGGRMYGLGGCDSAPDYVWWKLSHGDSDSIW